MVIYRGRDIDVFGYLEEIVIKKDLDDFDWFFSGYPLRDRRMIQQMIDEDDPELEEEFNEVYTPIRSSEYMLRMLRRLTPDLIRWISTGENISERAAQQVIEKFIRYEM